MKEEPLPALYKVPSDELVEFRNACIKYFYSRVCRQAEKNMAHTGKVEGAHWNAMKQVLAAWHIDVDDSSEPENPIP